MKANIKTPGRTPRRVEGLLLSVCLVLFICLVFLQYCADALQRHARKDEQNLEGAAESLERSLHYDPENAETYASLGAIYQKMATDTKAAQDIERLNLLKKAQRAYIQATHYAPTDSSNHMDLGWVRYQTDMAEGRPSLEGVKECFVLATQLDPYNYYTHYLLGSYLLVQDNLTDAFAEFRKTIQAYPHDEIIKAVLEKAMSKTTDYEELTRIIPEEIAVAHSYFAAALQDRLGRWDACKEEFKKIFALEPENTYYRDYYLSYCIGMRDITAAQEEVNARLALLGENPALRLRLAHLYKDVGNYQEALKECEKIKMNTPKFPGLATLVAEIQKAQGDTLAAIRAYENAIKEYPEDPKGYYELAKIYRDHGNKFNAAELFAKARFLRPKTFQYQEALGDAYLQVGMQERALEAFERCKEIDPRNPAPYLRLGELYITQKNWLNAAQEFGMVLKIDPKNTAALKGFLTAQAQIK